MQEPDQRIFLKRELACYWIITVLSNIILSECIPNTLLSIFIPVTLNIAFYIVIYYYYKYYGRRPYFRYEKFRRLFYRTPHNKLDSLVEKLCMDKFVPLEYKLSLIQSWTWNSELFCKIPDSWNVYIKQAKIIDKQKALKSDF